MPGSAASPADDMAMPQPGVVAGRRAVRQTIQQATAQRERTALLEREGTSSPSPVLVACSGGADSLALAACAVAEGRKHSVPVGAVIIDHQMQPGSVQVAAQAAQQCTELGLHPVEVVTIQVPPGNGGPEASARSARYAALDAARLRHRSDVVLLGHTLDDQAETVLMGLARGSGARALSGMPAARGALRRPFLGLPRTTTEMICTELGLTWWTDPTNIAVGNDPAAPLRSRMRSTVMPALTQVVGTSVVSALARSAAQLRDDDDLLRTMAQDALQRSRRAGTDVSTTDAAQLVLDTAQVSAEHPAVRHRLLHLAAITVGAAAGALNRTHIMGIDALLTNWHGQGPLDLPGGIQVRREYGTLVLQPTTS